MDSNGTIFKDGDVFIVQHPYLDYLSELPGVEVIEVEGEKCVQKKFYRKPIFLAHELKQAVSLHLRREPGSFVVSMNGYTTLSTDFLITYGIKPGAYKAACIRVFRTMLKNFRNRFPKTKVFVAHGAVDSEVDGALLQVKKEENLGGLGFSCPKFIFYVNDDDEPLYVANSVDGYADAYIQSLDFLISTGGRAHALTHDINASVLYSKIIYFVDLISMVAEVPVPSSVPLPGGGRQVENAAAAFRNNLAFFGSNLDRGSQTSFQLLDNDIFAVAEPVCRKVMPAELMFQT